jgi:hypothetical protein
VAYFGEANTYAGGPLCFDDLAWSPEGDNLYSYFCSTDTITNLVKGLRADGYKPPDVGTTNQAFTVGAAGNVDNDDPYDYWIMNDAKVLKNTQVDP